MARLLALLACLSVFCAGQVRETRRFASGLVQFQADGDGIVVLYHGHEWIPSLSRLPIRPDDCGDSKAREECRAHGGSGCLGCVIDWRPVAWDDLNETLYFAASTGPPVSLTRIVLAYDLRTDQINRVVQGPIGEHDGDGVVSPMGRYVAFLGHDVGSAGCTTSYLVLIDTQGGRLGSFRLPESAGDTVQVTGVRWIESTVIEYSAEVRRGPDCGANAAGASRKITGRLDVPAQLNGKDTAK